MMNRVSKIIIIELGWILFVSGCISTSQHYKLGGTRWILQTMHGEELLEDTSITLKLTEKEISGSAGCNLYFAQYTSQPKNRIEIDEVANTDMGCYKPVGIGEQEEEYIDTIQKSTSYRVDGEILIMVDKQGNLLLQYRLLPKFEANPEGLVGKSWRLKYANGMDVDEFGEFTLRFDRSTFEGTTPCRDYEGQYQTDEDSIYVTMIKMKADVECVQEDLISESTYTSFLDRIVQYNVSQNLLELYTVQNDKLVYELVSEK